MFFTNTCAISCSCCSLLMSSVSWCVSIFHFFSKNLSVVNNKKWRKLGVWNIPRYETSWCLPVKLQRVRTHHPSQYHTAKHAHHSQTHDEGGWQRVLLQVAWRALETGLCVSKNVPSLDWQSRLPSRDNDKSPFTSLPGSQFHHPHPLSTRPRPTSQSPVSIPFFSSISRQLSSSERLMRSFFTNFIWLPGYSWHNKVQWGYSIPLKKGGSNKKLRLTLQSDIFLVIRYRFPKVFNLSNVRCLFNIFL